MNSVSVYKLTGTDLGGVRPRATEFTTAVENLANSTGAFNRAIYMRGSIAENQVGALHVDSLSKQIS